MRSKNKKKRVQVNLNPDKGDKFGDFPTERTEESTAGGGEDKGSAYSECHCELLQLGTWSGYSSTSLVSL